MVTTVVLGIGVLLGAGSVLPEAIVEGASLVPPAQLRAYEEFVEVFSDDGELLERHTVNDKGEKTGPFEKFGPGGWVKARGHYRKGELDGKLEEFTEGGELALESVYASGALDGFYRRYKGVDCVLKASYKRGVLSGRWESFDPEKDHRILASYKRGLIDGRYVEIQNSGRWRRDANYKNGELSGAAKITLDKKIVSKRKWEKGLLVDLDGLAPFPVTLADLRAELSEARVVPDADPSDKRSPDRMVALGRLRTYRAACGVRWRHLRLDMKLNDLCDAASEVSQGNGKLSHTPEKPAGMDQKRFQQGYEGASNSNLSSGPVASSVDSYMDDSDASNIDRVGHRRWCLNPSMGVAGFGQAGRWSAMWATDQSGPGPGKTKTILYPPAGYVPVDLFGPRHAWSLHAVDGRMPKDAESLEIRVVRLDQYFQESGDPFELDWKSLSSDGFGGSPCIIFRPVGIETEAGARYSVTIQWSQGKEPDHRYVVEFVSAPERGRK